MEHIYKKIEGWFDFEQVYTRLVNSAQPYAHFVEVGSFQGQSTAFMAVEILNSKKDIRFDTVDTWEGVVDLPSNEDHRGSEPQQLPLFEAFKRNIKPVAHLINPVRMSSLEAAKTYKDRSLDFVFLDASHDYENVRSEILAWRPKIKVGGFLGGHDFQAKFPGIKRAVSELFPTYEVIQTSWLAQIK